MIRNTLASSLMASSLVLMATADKNSGANAAPPAPAPAPAAKKAEVKTLGIRMDIARPAGARKAGAKSKYPFDDLEVGGSFGVIGKDAAGFSSIIYSAQQRHAVPVLKADGTPETRMKKLKGGATEIVEKKKVTRKFSAYDVDPTTDPENATVRVFRDE